MLNRIIVKFKQYKHKGSRGQCTRIVGATQDKWCPVQLLSNYLTIRNSLQQTVGIPLFVTANGRPVQGGEARKALNRCLQSLGLDTSRYSAHGFRKGGATEAAARGASDAQLRTLGRWKTDGFLRYIRQQVCTFKY